MPLPQLAYDELQETRETLHLYAQILGKVKLAALPRVERPWDAPLHLTARGLTTGLMPNGLELRLDLLSQKLRVIRSTGRVVELDLEGQSVQSFYSAVTEAIASIAQPIHIDATPYDIPWVATTPFAEDGEHGGEGYRAEHARRIFRSWVAIYGNLFYLRTGFTGMVAEPALQWHHLDLSLRLYSGESAPEEPEYGGREVFSAGFSLGDVDTPEPYFYAWIYPLTSADEAEELRPSGSYWKKPNASAILLYRTVAPRDDWRDSLAYFFDSALQAETRAAGWDLESLTP